MRLSTLTKLITGGQASLLSKLLKTTKEFYRASFISAALSRGAYDNFMDGTASFEQLCENIAVSNREGLRAWLELEDMACLDTWEQYVVSHQDEILAFEAEWDQYFEDRGSRLMGDWPDPRWAASER